MGLRVKRLPLLFLGFLLVLCLSFQFQASKGSDTISPGQSLSGNQTIISSPEGNFELGFFTPGRSWMYYVGIWYKKVPGPQTVAWVANREQPVSDPSSSLLELSEDGNLVLLNQTKNPIWSTNSTSKAANTTVAVLLDNGNFVIRDALDSSIIIWQSFYHPADTWLPGGKVGYSKVTNEECILTSWRNPQNPAPSLFSYGMERNSTGRLWLRNGSQMYWTTGVWTGKGFSRVPDIKLNVYVTNITFVSNENETYFVYASDIPSALTRLVLDVSGELRQFVWHLGFAGWLLFWTEPEQNCGVHAFCGAFSVCNQQKEPLCACIEGFEPKMREDWELGDHTNGCMRKAPLKCDSGGNDSFLVMSNMQVPVNSESLAAETIEDCELACQKNCSCNAFAYDKGCLIWKGDLLNLQQLLPSEKIGRDIHLKVESELMHSGGKGNKKTALIVILAVAGFFALWAVFMLVLWRKRMTHPYKGVEGSLVLFKYKELRDATKNFSDKLGEGAFGSVFRGTLHNSTDIAVKKLNSLQQGEKQFLAEVKTIGTIQHINLVRLRGFCIEASKRFLVYDYMPNGSVEAFLFKKSARILDWKTRYHIAVGTARGLAYLHEDCRDCIIHCDIKPENILLDAECNPKVADLGLAKILGRDFSRVLTTVRGTRGYLAPEWISGDAITPKADVFSYGMLLCEVISGRRNRDYSDEGTNDYFPFQLANVINKAEDALTLLDDSLEGHAPIEELTRTCRVACWCIQEDEKHRPSMRQIVQILEGVSEISLPPIPPFLQHLSENEAGPIAFQETSSGSGLWA